ncbi:hypothetical protein EBR66_03780 [bacterium]|nr:hypothetical protein [bacterium]
MSDTRIYLKGDFPFKTESDPGFKRFLVAFDRKVDESLPGHPFIRIGDPMKPGFVDPQVPPEYCDYVLHQSTWVGATCKDGLYGNGGSITGRIETIRAGTEQSIEVKADTIDGIRVAYDGIRTGRWQPTNDWSGRKD